MGEGIKAAWPGWKTVRLIGQGSFGAVYEIQRKIQGKIESAALKVISISQNESEITELRREGYDDESIIQYFTDGLHRIKNEYVMMTNMKEHSNVVYCDDIMNVQQENGFGWNIFIKMELLYPLKTYFANGAYEAQVIKLGMDLCNALIMCEKLNVMQRDIKLENIFVSRQDGNFKLGDFGIAKTIEHTSGGRKNGTFDYMAPEVFNNQPYHHEADIYSLSLVMYWLLNERTSPLLAISAQKPTPSMKATARERRFSGESIPEPLNGSQELKEIVLKACAFEPQKCFRTAQDMYNALAGIKSGVVSSDDKTVSLILGGKGLRSDKTVSHVHVNKGTRNKRRGIWGVIGVVAFMLLFSVGVQGGKKSNNENIKNDNLQESYNVLVKETEGVEDNETSATVREEIAPKAYELSNWLDDLPASLTKEEGKSNKNVLGENWVEDTKREMSGEAKTEVCIEMTGLSQKGIPTGCESVSTVMVLNYMGIEIEPETFIDNYLPCGEFYRQGERIYGPDPHQVFAGNPYKKNSLGCFPQVIIKALENMQGCHYPGMDSMVFQDVSGASLEELASKYIANDIPVLLWVTMGMDPSYEGMSYYLVDGSLYTWRAGEHCMVLCGYDETTYYMMDPLADGQKVGFPKEIVEARYEERGQYAVVINHCNF